MVAGVSETSAVWVHRAAYFMRKGILGCGIPWLASDAAVAATGWDWKPELRWGLS
jgi:hypothetical protein